MGNTRNQLAAIGADALGQSEELVQAGVRTIRDVVRETLAAKGISEAVGFELTLLNGEKLTIVSDSNPAMDRPAAEVREVAVKQSARAGFTIRIR